MDSNERVEVNADMWLIILLFIERPLDYFSATLINKSSSIAACRISSIKKEHFVQFTNEHFRGGMWVQDDFCHYLPNGLKHGLELFVSIPKRVGGPYYSNVWACQWNTGVKHGIELFGSIPFDNYNAYFRQTIDEIYNMLNKNDIIINCWKDGKLIKETKMKPQHICNENDERWLSLVNFTIIGNDIVTPVMTNEFEGIDSVEYVETNLSDVCDWKNTSTTFFQLCLEGSIAITQMKC
eukprot:523886_1